MCVEVVCFTFFDGTLSLLFELVSAFLFKIGDMLVLFDSARSEVVNRNWTLESETFLPRCASTIDKGPLSEALENVGSKSSCPAQL